MVSRSKQCWCPQSNNPCPICVGRWSGSRCRWGAESKRAVRTGPPPAWATGWASHSAAARGGKVRRRGQVNVKAGASFMAPVRSCPLQAVFHATATVAFLHLGSDPGLFWLKTFPWPPQDDHPGPPSFLSLRCSPSRSALVVTERTERRGGPACRAVRAGWAAEEHASVRAHRVQEPRRWSQLGETSKS